MSGWGQPRAVRALAAQGLRAYFEAPSAYVALTAFYLLVGYLFAAPLFLIGQASIKPLADLVPMLLIFIVPGLTMGLLAEELRSGTFETLATLPLEDSDIVLGKFLGFASLQALMIAGLLVYPVILRVLGTPPATIDWGETAGILAGLLLLGLMFGAAGLFASSLSRSLIVSFILAFLLCFAFFAAGKLAPYAPGPLGRLADFLGCDSHVDSMAKGVIDTRDLLYFATMTCAFLYLTVQRLQARRL